MNGRSMCLPADPIAQQPPCLVVGCLFHSCVCVNAHPPTAQPPPPTHLVVGRLILHVIVLRAQALDAVHLGCLGCCRRLDLPLQLLDRPALNECTIGGGQDGSCCPSCLQPSLHLLLSLPRLWFAPRITLCVSKPSPMISSPPPAAISLQSSPVIPPGTHDRALDAGLGNRHISRCHRRSDGLGLL